jgi:hypothetical protein
MKISAITLFTIAMGAAPTTGMTSDFDYLDTTKINSLEYSVQQIYLRQDPSFT